MFSRVRGQATKSERWMPWRREAMKDVASCDKPRGAASRHRSEDVRMGEPGWGNAHSSVTESIGHGTRTGGTETSQYLEGKESNRGQGSEREPETVCLQAAGGLCRRKTEGLTACLLHNEPASYWYVARLSVEGAEP